MSRELIDSGIDWIGFIPETWKLERLQWHLDEIKESNNPIQTLQVLSLTNKLGVIPYEEKGDQGNKAKEKIDEYKLAYPDTIVANSMNVLIGSVGKCNYFGCVSPVYYVYKGKENVNIDYFNYLFQTQEFQKELRRYANGILEIRLRVSSSNILKRYVPIPSLEEQNVIVNVLNEKISKIDELIKIQDGLINKFELYKKAFIREIVTKGINKEMYTNLNIRNIKKIPNDWKICRLKNVATISNGKDIKCDGGIIPVYGSGGIFKFTNEYLYDGPSILLGRKGTIDKPIFVTGKFWTVDTMFYTSEIRNIAPKFLFYCCKELIDYNFYKSGSVLPSMTQTELNNVFLTYPSLSEQVEIVKIIEGKTSYFDNLIKLKQDKILKLQEYKKSLIYEYVTGKKSIYEE